MRHLVIALIGSWLATAAAAENDVRLAAEVAQTEAAFQTATQRVGIVPAFREYVADDGIMFLPDPVIVKPTLTKASWPGSIVWRPAFIAASRDGTLAVSIGPSAWTIKDKVDPGYYLTIWRREPTGALRFVVDRGTVMSKDLSASEPPAPDVSLSVKHGDVGNIAALESTLAEAALNGGWPAATSLLAPHGRVLRDRAPPAIGPEAARRLLPASRRVVFKMLESKSAKSGDLGYAYGTAEWTHEGKQEKGYYLRVWQRVAAGWRIVVDHWQPRG